MSLFNEIKRRKVFQVAAVYAVVAWIVVQVVATIEQPLNLPGWFDTTVIVALILGFPITLVMSWAFNLTSAGFLREQQQVRTHDGGRRIELALIGLLVVAVGFLFLDAYVLEDSRQRSRAAAAAATGVDGSEPSSEATAEPDRLENSVAVLPFADLSPDPDDAYYAAGIHDEVLSQLAKLDDLSVISRTSVLRYEGTELSIPEIASELNVDTVMEGTVRFAGDRIRVTTQLIDATTDEHLWSETYERAFDDIFAIESDIAMHVANALRAEFSLEEQRSIEKVPTDSPEAYSLYLQALGETSGIDLDVVEPLMDEALRLDPEFALAHAQKAAAYSQAMINTVAGNARQEWLELAERATASAERALAIDADVALAHAALGFVHGFLWRFDESRRAFERAHDLTRNGGGVLRGYSWNRTFAGDYAAGIRLAERRVALAPLTSGAHVDLGLAHAYAGNLGAARDAYRNAVEVESANLVARTHLGLVEARAGNAEAAASLLASVEDFAGNNLPVVFLPELAVGYARVGRDRDAARLADRILSLAEERDVGSGTIAMAYLAIGDADRALAELEIAAERIERNEPDQGYFSLMHIKHNFIAHPLLEEPRFVELRQRLGGA